MKPSFPVIILLLIPAITVFPQGNTKQTKLAYTYVNDTPVNYLSSSKIIQDMDINGQSMKVNVTTTFGCKVRSTGTDGNNVMLEITIDTLAQTMDTPAGLNYGETKDLIGKMFSLKISPQGRETDLKGTDNLNFKNGDGSETPLDQFFNDFFPDLPDELMTPGYKWTSSDTLTNKTPSLTLTMIVISENKFDGYEMLNGTNCAKISYSLSGTRDMKTQSQGMDIKVTGPFTGTGELSFDNEKGYFIKHEVKTRMTGQIEINSPENMSFPVIMDTNSTTERRQ